MDVAIDAIDGDVLTRNDVKKLCDERFFDMLSKYVITKVMGNPNGNVGWANEPLEFVEAFTALELEDGKLQKEEMDKKDKESKAKSAISAGRSRMRRRR